MYIDECHNFLNLPFPLEDMLAEARGYRLSLVLAHQNLAQLPPDLREGISANTRNKVFFTCSPEDARALAIHSAPNLSEHDLSHLGGYQAAVRLTVDGVQAPAFTIRTRPLPAPIEGRADTIRAGAHAAARARGRRPLHERRIIMNRHPTGEGSRRSTDVPLANRITGRDARLLRLLCEHRVLTSAQITTALFGDGRNARRRIATLRAAGLVETFRPPTTAGSSPLHCVPTAKALRLIADDDVRTAGRSARADAAVAAALRPDLEHLKGINEVFCQLLGDARTTPQRDLETWLSEWSATRLFSSQIRPDGFGRWRDGEAWSEFFLEYDTGSEPQHRLIDKLAGYERLSESAAVWCPVLFWLPGPEREANLHRNLAQTRTRVPVATAHGDPRTTTPSGVVWRPAWCEGPRQALAELGASAAARLGHHQRPHRL